MTETFRRVDYDTLEWSETIEDPIMYTRPWDTMKLPMRTRFEHRHHGVLLFIVGAEEV